MSAAAIALTDEGIMKRPTRRDACVRRRAAEIALPEVKAWMGSTDGRSDESLIETLMKVIGGSDGFQMAKDLDDLGWHADSALVGALDGSFIDDALREMEKQWVACLGVKLEIPVGAEVRYTGEIGIIVHRDEGLAHYGVRMPGMPENCWRVCDAEEVRVTETEGARV